VSDAPAEKPRAIVRHLGRQDYESVWQAMQQFTAERTAETTSEIWVVEHNPVFTQGQAGKAEHVLNPGDIPIVQTDRGGQVTYHGPGQLVIYLLMSLRETGLGVRGFVSAMENAVIEVLASHGIEAQARADAPGVYVGDAKIAALGLRVKRGYTYHGLAFNIDMDLEPFSRINPCGYQGMAVTQTRALGVRATAQQFAEQLIAAIAAQTGHQILDPTYLGSE
jgi:lipoyl(octanoyl) transferase